MEKVGGGEGRKESRIDNELKEYDEKDIKEIRIVERVCEAAFFPLFYLLFGVFYVKNCKK
jgi:hypothetical protein